MKRFISCLLIFVSSSVFANTISIYAKPEDNAQVISQVRGGTQLIPIYYPKTGKWLKVANPTNGNVGWIRFADLSGESTLPGLHEMKFKQRLESRSKDNGPEVVRIIEYSGPQKLSEAEIKTLVEQMQRRQAQLNATMQLMMRAMVQDFNNFSREDSFAFEDDFFTFPLIQPMLIVPQQGDPNKPAQQQAKSGWWQSIKKKMSI